MRKITILIVALFLSGMVGKAQNAVTTKGSDLPKATSGWQELKMDKTINAIAGAAVTTSATGDVLKLTFTPSPTDGGYNQLGWFKKDLGFSSSIGFTVDIRAKVLKADGTFNISGVDGSGRGFRLVIKPNALIESTNALLFNTLETATNSDKFYTWRITVAPDNMVRVYRDSTPIGEFPLAPWYGDNLITDGGFETGRTLQQLGWEQSAGEGTLTISNDPAHAQTGSNGLLIDGGTHTYRPIPLKEAVNYEMNFYGKTIQYRTVNPPGAEWRDMDGNITPDGVPILSGGDARWERFRVIHAIMDRDNFDWYKFQNGVFNYGFHGGGAAKTFVVRTPVNTSAPGNISAYDNFWFAEKMPTYAEYYSRIPANAVNLFPNGDFEDPDFAYPQINPEDLFKDNKLATGETRTDPDWHPFWRARVRLQSSPQMTGDDTFEAGPYYARGKYSLRFFNCFNNNTII
jgi:hypothetical protein